MSWTLAVSALATNKIQFPYQFNSGNLIVSISSYSGSQNNWIRAGWLTEIASHALVGDARGARKRVLFETRCLQFTPTKTPFVLEFQPERWVRDAQIKIYEAVGGDLTIRSLPDWQGDSQDLIKVLESLQSPDWIDLQ